MNQLIEKSAAPKLTKLFHLRAVLMTTAFFILTAAAQSVSAATYTVTNTFDTGAGSLRAAVASANMTTPADVIVFDIPTSDMNYNSATGVYTITLASEIKTNNNPLSITGLGANRLTISGGGVTRIFNISDTLFTLSGVTLKDGNGFTATGDLSGFGGAIYVPSGKGVTLDSINVTGNTSSGGGAVYFASPFLSNASYIRNSTFSGNTSSAATAGACGGAINNNTRLVISNSTFTGNSCAYGGAIYSNGSMELYHATITNNTANSEGGGLYLRRTVSFSNSIIAGNNNGDYPEIFNFSTAVSSQGYNIVGDAGNDAYNTNSSVPYQSTDILNTPPQLGGLGNNGGTVPTMRPSPTSPAIDKGSAVTGIFRDARGVIRPYDIFTTANASGGNGADIGAFELIPTSEFGWGFNGSGQVGDGTMTNRSLPTQIAGGFNDIVSIEGGSNHALALRSNGTLLAWGSNNIGQLGDGTATQRNSPVAVINLTNVVAIAGGGSHSLALLADGTVWGWGSNMNGQLGNSMSVNSTTPIAVGGVTNAVAVAAGNNSSYALLADGSVLAWGRNSSGQIGDGTTTNAYAPVQVSGLTSGVISIDSGSNTVYAVLSDGSVRAWGSNTNGQIGDGTTTTRLTPVTPLNLTSGVVQIAGGFFYAAALKSDGTVLTWGLNTEGELGDGTTTNNSTPTAIALANVTEIKSSLGSATYARLRDGSLYAWGSNFYGAVGNGMTATAQTTPARVSIDAGIGFFGASGNAGYAGSPLASVSTGANQFVRLGDATVNFGNVATAGTAQIRTFDPSSSGLNVPSSYTIIANSNGYDITSSAQFTGSAQVCLKVPNVIDQTSFGRLYILHDDDGDGTLDAGNNTRTYQKREICRATSSFSPFVVALGPLAPTAAGVSISGRVITPLNLGLTNALVTLTDSTGNSRTAFTGRGGRFYFDEVAAGETYILSVQSKRYRYAPQIINVTEDMTEVDFAPQ